MFAAVIQSGLRGLFVTEWYNGLIFVPSPFKRHPRWEGTNIMSKTLLKDGLVVIIGGGGLVLSFD